MKTTKMKMTKKMTTKIAQQLCYSSGPLTLKSVERGSEGITATPKMKTALEVLQQHDPLRLEYIERGPEGGG